MKLAKFTGYRSLNIGNGERDANCAERSGTGVQRNGQGPDETSAAAGLAMVSDEQETEGDGNPPAKYLDGATALKITRTTR